MKLAGPAANRAREVGLVLGRDRVLTTWGVRSLAELDKSTRLFAYDPLALMDDVLEGNGAVTYWKSRITGYLLDGHNVRVPGSVFDCDPAHALFALDSWAAWLHELGSAPGSFAGASLGILKAVAGDEFYFASEAREKVPRSMLLGARQECKPGVYAHADHYDVPAAYPTTLGDLWVPLRYRHFTSGRTSPKATSGMVGFARAEVKLPELAYGPLPIALHGPFGATFPTSGEVAGVWDYAELALAAELGAKVKVRESWVGTGLSPTFRAWRDAVLTGRELTDPHARTLAKATAVALWGFFAASGERIKVSFINGQEVRDEGTHREPSAYPIAAHTAAAMRIRLYREALVHDPILAHTDGAIFPQGSPAPAWRHEGTYRRLEVLTAQNYRAVDTSGEVTYCLAGVPAHNAAKVWREKFGRFQASRIGEERARDIPLREFRTDHMPEDYVAPAIRGQRARKEAETKASPRGQLSLRM